MFTLKQILDWHQVDRHQKYVTISLIITIISVIVISVSIFIKILRDLRENKDNSIKIMDSIKDDESQWPPLSIKYGKPNNLRKISNFIEYIKKDDMIILWNKFDTKNSNKISTKSDTFIKLLSTLFLYYFKLNPSSDIIKYHNISPLINSLSKYIIPQLSKSKYITKSEFVYKIHEYFNIACLHRTKYINKNKK